MGLPTVNFIGSSNRYHCQFCLKIKTTFTKFINHISLYHQHIPKFIIKCPVQNCNKQYKNILSLKSHFYKKHYLKKVVRGINLENDIHFDDNNNSDNNSTISNIIPDTPFQYNSQETIHLSISMKKQLILFMLKIQENYILPKSVTDSILNDISYLLHCLLSSYKSIIQNAFFKNKSLNKISPDIVNLVFDDNYLFDSLKPISQFKLNTYCKNNMNLVESKDVILDEKCSYQYG